MNWKKVKCVASFEFWSTVKRKGYLIATFGMPVIVLAYGGIITFVGKTVNDEESKPRLYAVVDDANFLELGSADVPAPSDIPPEITAALDRLPQNNATSMISAFRNTTFRKFDNVDQAVDALRDKVVSGVFVIPDDFIQEGKIEVYRGQSVSSGVGDAGRTLETMMKNRMLEDTFQGDMLERVKDPIKDRTTWTLNDLGEIEPYSVAGRIAKLAVPILFMVMLFISLMMSGTYLLQGTSTEKENKVVEVLLSSAEPQEILTGKLFGLGAAGLIQVFVWFGMVIAGTFISAAVFSIATDIPIPWVAITMGVFLFILAYLFIGSLMLGTGSLGSNMKEAQQYSMLWTMLCVLPLMFLGAIVTAPSGTVAKVLTWIPFSTPTMLIYRLAMEPEELAWWELVGATTLLILCTVFAIRWGGRLFRVGLLLGGGKIKWKEIWRQAKLGHRA